MSITNQRLMDVIVGEQLVEVVFIHDYIQLDFNGPRLTALTQPRVNVGNGWLKYKEKGYCDDLCSCICATVRKAVVVEDNETGKDIELYFELSNGALISVSTRPSDIAPEQVEAAILETDVGWEVWADFV